MRRLALATAAAVSIAACSGMVTPWPSPSDLHVVNETTRAMTILVNGALATTVPPQASATLPGGEPARGRLPG